MFMKKKCGDSEFFGKLTRGKLLSNLVDTDILYFTVISLTPLIAQIKFSRSLLLNDLKLQ